MGKKADLRKFKKGLKNWQKNKKPPAIASGFVLCWRKPIFPGRHQPSIFGAGELNFRVRDGNGWTLAAINTNCVCCLSGQLNYNTTLFQKMQAPICIFLKKFLEKGKGHLARATSRGRKRLQKTINAGPAPPSPTKLGSEAPCATCPARVTGRGRKRLQKTINAGPPPPSPIKLGSEAPCATCPARVTGPPGTKKQPSYWTTALSVGENLFFRAVTSQVSSAPASLTSVFGMGTGGPSRQSTPTCVCRLSRRLSNNTTPFQEMQALFLKKLKKVFISPKTDGKRLTSRPNQPAAWRPAPSGAGPGTASPGNAPGLPYPSGR